MKKSNAPTHADYSIHLPNYKDGSIVNLMSSILKAHGYEPEYEPLRTLDQNELRVSTNAVLIVIDGLGYEYITKYGSGSVFAENIKDKMTSVFPATTASGITTFLTGVAPQQHAITGWFMYLKELGVVSTILPFMPRYGRVSFCQTNINPATVFNQKSLFEKISVDSYYVIHEQLMESDYTAVTAKSAKRKGFYALTDFFKQIKEIIVSESGKKYISAYWHKFDAICHEYGVNSDEALAHFKELNSTLISFLESIKGTNTVVIVTSDHGLIDTENSRIIKLKEHPEFVDTLTLPLCGEPRVVYCYVRPSRVDDFKKYVRESFSGACELHRGEELIDNNYFGLFEPNERLFDRVGDYVLIMKENYVMKDLVMGERERYHRGNHGGVSKEEMFVPLIVFRK